MPTNAMRTLPKMGNPFISLKQKVKQNLLAQPVKIYSKISKNNPAFTPIITKPKEKAHWVVPSSDTPYVLTNVE